MNKLKQMLSGHHSHEDGGSSHGIPDKSTESAGSTGYKASSGEMTDAGNTAGHGIPGLTAKESDVYGDVSGASAVPGNPSGAGTTGTSSSNFASSDPTSAEGVSGLAATGTSTSDYPTATSGNILHDPHAANDASTTASIKSGVQGNRGDDSGLTTIMSDDTGLTGTSLVDRSVDTGATTGSSGYTTGAPFVEPTYRELGVDATGGPHPTFTGNRLDPGFTESIPSYHEELAHDAQHATGGSRGNLGPTGMAATTTYEDPNYSAGYTGATEYTEPIAAVPAGYESARGYTQDTTESAPVGYETAKDESTGSAPAGYESARDYTSGPTDTSTSTGGIGNDSSSEPRAYGQDGPNRFAEERGVSGGTGVPATEVGIDSKTQPDTGASAYETGNTTGTTGTTGDDYEVVSDGNRNFKQYPTENTGTSSTDYDTVSDGNRNYKKYASEDPATSSSRDYQTGSNTEQGSSSGYGREAAEGAAAGGSVGALLYEHNKNTGLSESEKAAAVRRYEAGQEEERNSSSKQQSGYGSTSGNQQSSDYSSAQQTGYSGGNRDLDTAYHMGRGDLTDENGPALGVAGRNARSSAADEGAGSTPYGEAGAAGVGAAGVGAYEYEKSGSSSAPQGYESARGYQSGTSGDAYATQPTSSNTGRFTEGAAVTSSGAAGSYDPYAVNSTTGPTGFATGFVGDSKTGEKSGYGSAYGYDSTGSSQPVGAAESSYDPYTAKTSGTGGTYDPYANESTTAPTGYATGFKNDDSTLGNTPSSSTPAAATKAETGTGTGQPAYGAYEDQRADQPSTSTGTTATANTEKRHGLSALLHRENPNKLRKEPPGGRYSQE